VVDVVPATTQSLSTGQHNVSRRAVFGAIIALESNQTGHDIDAGELDVFLAACARYRINNRATALRARARQ